MAEVTTPSKRSKLAIASFVLGLLSCLLFPAPLAFVLGVIAIVQTSNDPHLRGRNFAVAGTVLAVVFGVLSLLAAMAIPSYLRFPKRAKMAECKTNLKSLFTTARAMQQDKEQFTADFVGLEWEPDKNRRYAYVTAAMPISLEEGRTVLLPDLQGSVTQEQVSRYLATMKLSGGLRPGVEGVCPDDCHFTALCIANLDDDEVLDVWSVSTKNQGELIHESDDTAD